MGVHREDDGKEDGKEDDQAPVCAATSAGGAGIIRG
jgi:hypothetical protein